MSFFANKWRGFKRKWKFFWSVNWYKTLYFNFKKFPFSIAMKLPVFFFGKVKFSDISGEIKIEAPITAAMIAFGHKFEKWSRHKGIAELSLIGKIVFKGYFHVGKDYLIYIGKDAYCEIGNMSAFGSDVKMICTSEIRIGNWTGVGYESQLLDTNSHPMVNTKTGMQYPMVGAIELGDYNAISNRVSIMPNTKTPNNCVIASNSVCSKNYKDLGSCVLIGGIPAKLIKENYARDWEFEKEKLIKNKVIKF